MIFQALGIEVSHPMQGLSSQKSQISQDHRITHSRSAATTDLFFAIGGETQNGTESDVSVPSLKKGRLSKVRLKIVSNTFDQILTLTIRKNNSNTPIVFTIPATNSVDQESGVVVELDILDTYNYRLEGIAATGIFIFSVYALLELNS